MNIILYSTHCPKCKILENKLKEKEIGYEECNDVDLMCTKGFLSVPKLEIDGNILDFGEAIMWINEQ